MGRNMMRKTTRAALALLAVICLLTGLAGSALSETLQDCHKVTNKAEITTQKNKSQIR